MGQFLYDYYKTLQITGNGVEVYETNYSEPRGEYSYVGFDSYVVNVRGRGGTTLEEIIEEL